VGLIGVFSEVIAILEQLCAFHINTLEDPRRVCVVARHVQLVIVVAFGDLAAQETRVENFSVHTSLVMQQIQRILARVGAARDVALVKPRLRVSTSHVPPQHAVTSETVAAKCARDFHSSEVHLLVQSQILRGRENAGTIFEGALH
jgi:hypothetical protein